MQLDPARYLRTFFDEATEHVAALEGALLRLESGPHDPELIDAAFRAAHSVKGGADAVGLAHVAKFTHAVEGFLDQFRGGGRIPRRVLDLLLEATDMLSRLVTTARGGEAPPPGADELLARLATKGSDAAPTKSWWESPKGLDHLKSQPGAEPVPTACTVAITPHADALRSGLDPLPLLRELAALGTVERVDLNANALPPFGDLDPERCYLAWTVRLSTIRPPDAIRDVFAFAPDLIAVTVTSDRPPPRAEPSRAAPPAPAMNVTWATSFERRLPVPDPVRFAHFLVQRGTVTPEQALAALATHHEARPALGLVAVRAGLATVEKLKGLVGQMHPGEGFGAAAVRLGFLSEGDLGRLLLLQEQQTPPIGDAVLALGAVTRDDLSAVLAAYRVKAAAEPDAAASYCDVPLAPVEVPRSPGASLLNENGAMLGDFCAEAAEHLETADRNLLVIDADPTNADALNAVYRGFHTIKGVSSMLGLAAVQMLAHEAENLLNLAREGKVRLQGKPMDLVFASTDALKRQVAFIRAWSLEGGTLAQDPALPALLADLRSAVNGPTAPKPPKPAPKVEASAPVPAPEPPPAAPAPKPEKAEAAPAPEGAAPRRVAEKETVRVDKDRLDKLINTIGELVIAQSMAQQEYDELSNGSGVASLALPELSKISRDLQELSLGLRMVPLQGTFQKMARLVRDLSRKMDKPVELDLHGEETELDKTVVDQLGDPLMHMVRNAIDHGLEEPDERVAAGKPREGHVTLRAFHQGGSVFIELTDDGKGLDRDRILKKALEKGIIAEGQRLSDSEIYALIFEPGFSTAKAVTDVSGRGVGMDVVRRNVEALQGNILIRTQPGRGTTFTIRLPLTLAIMDGLMVGLCDDVYVLPLLSVVESFRPRPADLHRVVGRGEAVTVRGEVVPLLRLHRLFGRTSRVTDPCKGLVVLVEDQGKKHAVLVDELLGQMQAVVKSLDANYRRVEGLAGATILGDGRVAMILDIHGLAQLHAQSGRAAPEPALALAGSDHSFGDAP